MLLRNLSIMSRRLGSRTRSKLDMRTLKLIPGAGAIQEEPPNPVVSPNQLGVGLSKTRYRANVLAVSHNSTAVSHKKTENFILPDIGEGINEVVIKEWQVKVGDVVREFDPICEVESDKATATISSRFDGIITKIHYDLGAMAKVGKPLVDIEVSGGRSASGEAPTETVEPTTSSKDVPSPSSTTTPTPTATSTTTITSAAPARNTERRQESVATLPSVRRLSRAKGVDLTKVTPTGKNNRILKEDVLNYLNSANPNANLGPANPRDGPRGLTSIVPLRGIRKAMFKTMTQSLKIPHFGYSDEFDLTQLLQTCKRYRDLYGSEETKIGTFAVIIKLVSAALKRYPHLNASLDEEGQNLVVKNYHNIGVAVDTEAGLVVPNIKNVQDLSVKEISLELSRLRELGYSGKLGPADLADATLTLSNIGAIGGVFGVPVLVAPEIVIGALGRTRKLPRFNESGAVEERQIMQIVWSADHRAVDGATLCRFSNLLKDYIENPDVALLDV